MKRKKENTTNNKYNKTKHHTIILQSFFLFNVAQYFSAVKLATFYWAR